MAKETTVEEVDGKTILTAGPTEQEFIRTLSVWEETDGTRYHYMPNVLRRISSDKYELVRWQDLPGGVPQFVLGLPMPEGIESTDE